MNRSARSFLLVFLLATALRGVVAFAWADPPAWDVGDIAEYDRAARAGSWSTDAENWAVREPGYPLFLRLAYALPGTDAWGVLLLQSLAGGLAAAAVLLGLRGMLPPGVVGLAALWVAVCPELLWMAGRPLRENLTLPLFVIFVLWLVRGGAAVPGVERAQGAGSARRGELLGAGAALTLLVHTDARFLAMLPVVPLALWVLDRSGRAVRDGVILASVVAVLTVPYSWGLSAAVGRPVLLAERVLTKWAPRAMGETGARGAADVVVSESDAHVGRQAWVDAWEAARPESELALINAGVRPAVAPAAVVRARLTEYWRFARWRPGYLPYPDGRYAKPWSRRHQVVATVSVLPVLLLAPWAWRGRATSERRVLTAIVVFLIAHVAVHVLVHARDRYRLPAEGLWAIPVAAALVRPRGPGAVPSLLGRPF